MREQSNFRVQDHRDQVPSGAYILADGTAMNDLVDRLQNGQASVGWEGDPRLCIAYNRQTTQWELWRAESDGQYRMVMRSKPGMSFPMNLIEHLMQHDNRRKFDALRDVDKHNDLQRALAASQLQEHKDAAAEKARWALKKDLSA